MDFQMKSTWCDYYKFNIKHTYESVCERKINIDAQIEERINTEIYLEQLYIN